MEFGFGLLATALLHRFLQINFWNIPNVDKANGQYAVFVAKRFNDFFKFG